VSGILLSAYQGVHDRRAAAGLSHEAWKDTELPVKVWPR